MNKQEINDIHTQLDKLMGLTVDMVLYEFKDCRVIFREVLGGEPVAAIIFRDCLHITDTGIINCVFDGYVKYFDLGVALWDLANFHRIDSKSYFEFKFWTDTKSSAKYAGYEYTGMSVGFKEMEISWNHDDFMTSARIRSSLS